MGKQCKQWQTFLCEVSKITADGDCSHEIKRCLLLGRKAMTNLDNTLKNRDITLLTKIHLVSYGFSSSHVWMWELYHKEDWVPKYRWFWNMVLEKILESPLDSKEIKPISLKEKQPWIVIGRTDAETEAPIFWPPEAKNQLIRKDPGAGKDRRQEKGATEDAMVGWQHQLNGREFEQAGKPGVLQSMGSQRVGHDWTTEWGKHSVCPTFTGWYWGWGDGVLNDTILNLAELQHGSILCNPPRISSKLKDSPEWWTSGILSTTSISQHVTELKNTAQGEL